MGGLGSVGHERENFGGLGSVGHERENLGGLGSVGHEREQNQKSAGVLKRRALSDKPESGVSGVKSDA